MAGGSESSDSTTLAAFACVSCRVGKRRCDKQLPACGLCARKRNTCIYTTRDRETEHRRPDVSPASLDTLISRPVEVFDGHSSEQLSRHLHFNTNAAFFIMLHAFRQAQLELTSCKLKIPNDVQLLIGNIQSIRDTAMVFFSIFHRWLPIISKQGFLNQLLNPLAQRQTELSLLALAMRLCCTPPMAEGARSSLYLTTKRFYHEVELTGLLSIYVLQANVMIAFYELSHAIYPNAYLTGGACARYALALGIDQSCAKSAKEYDPQLSFHEVEERRRLWWAVLMVDRFSKMNDSTRPLVTQDPAFDSYLPVDDAKWDDCTAKAEDAVTISTGFTLKMGCFARLAQSTFLLSQALRITMGSRGMEHANETSEIVQLRRTLLALIHAADREAVVRRLEFCAQSAVSLSTILLLQDYELQRRQDELSSNASKSWDGSLYEETQIALERLTAATPTCITSCTHGQELLDHIPIWIIHVMYHVPSLLLTMSEHGYDFDVQSKIHPFKELLRLVDTRWRLSGKFSKTAKLLRLRYTNINLGTYLSILEAREIMIPFNSQNKQSILPSI